MGDFPKMNENVKAVSVNSTFGVGTISNGTPGKASGYGVENAPLAAEGIDSADETKPFPGKMDPYWNSDNVKNPE